MARELGGVSDAELSKRSGRGWPLAATIVSVFALLGMATALGGDRSDGSVAYAIGATVVPVSLIGASIWLWHRRDLARAELRRRALAPPG